MTERIEGTIARASYDIVTMNGTINVTVGVDLHEVARQLAHKARKSKRGIASAVGSAVMVSAPRSR